MQISIITRSHAVVLAGSHLPYGFTWYMVTGLEFYPMYADYAYTWTTEHGLAGVIGKRKEARAVA